MLPVKLRGKAPLSPPLFLLIGVFLKAVVMKDNKFMEFISHQSRTNEDARAKDRARSAGGPAKRSYRPEGKHPGPRRISRQPGQRDRAPSSQPTKGDISPGFPTRSNLKKVTAQNWYVLKFKK